MKEVMTKAEDKMKKTVSILSSDYTAIRAGRAKDVYKRQEQVQLQETVDYDFTGKRVLLAEDNAINTEVAVLLLKNKGFEVEKMCIRDSL